MALVIPYQERDHTQRTLTHAAIVVSVGVLATSLAQPQILAGIPLENLLKNELHVDRAANAAFFSELAYRGISNRWPV